ncbi:uncharacterized protein PV06_08290 [Exophiala oligosperma]|uniref:Secreted protein n=1 Tax=Exophiala oligosperma TaxID=215243 RepID=A0A0D2AHT0_9EURO|nr:uncharacterized protein PV06_08290 [Exophiala oligosperma]KIW39701.1 hypothetical protein PV06_08290 [Exophiala oligosperma]
MVALFFRSRFILLNIILFVVVLTTEVSADSSIIDVKPGAGSNIYSTFVSSRPSVGDESLRVGSTWSGSSNGPNPSLFILFNFFIRSSSSLCCCLHSISSSESARSIFTMSSPFWLTDSHKRLHSAIARVTFFEVNGASHSFTPFLVQ